MHFPHKTLPQKPMKQEPMKQATTHTSQCNDFTACYHSCTFPTTPTTVVYTWDVNSGSVIWCVHVMWMSEYVGGNAVEGI